MQTLVKTDYVLELGGNRFLIFKNLNEIKNLFKNHLYAQTSLPTRVIKRTFWWNSETHLIATTDVYVDSF